jgi:hypothetical protein
MGKQVIGIALSSLVLLVLSAHLNAFTLASVPTSRAHFTNKETQLNIIKNNFNRDQYDINSVASKHDHLVSLRAGGDTTTDGCEPSLVSKANTFVNKNFFLVGMFLAVILAKLVPSVSCPKRVPVGSWTVF